MNSKLSKYDDKQLVKLMRKGKKDAEAAFTEIYDRYSLRINAYCLSILGNKELAEDIFQETFIRFFNRAKSENVEGSIIGFLVTISRNLCLNAKRDRKINVPVEDYILPVVHNDELETKELSELLMMSLELIDPVEKEILVLREFNDMRYKEIGEILNITDAKARYLAFTGKQKIKNILSPYFKNV